MEGKENSSKILPCGIVERFRSLVFYLGVVDETNVKVYQCLPKEKGSIYVNVII
jgi:hypothetical protein